MSCENQDCHLSRCLQTAFWKRCDSRVWLKPTAVDG